MGDMADAILDGTFCQVCGQYMEGENAGYPVTCDGCEEENKND